MDSEVKLHMFRAEDEFLLAENDMKLSTDKELKKLLGIQEEKTFFYSVITHSYYAIFNCAKAYLISKKIKTKPPEEHKKIYNEFRKLVNLGELNKELLVIYEEETIKAEALLDILALEKRKRGFFTYKIKSEANIPYAKESIENARKFLSSIKAIIEKELK